MLSTPTPVICILSRRAGINTLPMLIEIHNRNMRQVSDDSRDSSGGHTRSRCNASGLGRQPEG